MVIEDSAAPICNAQGELTGVVLVFRDVTERKLQELAVARVAERERRIAETLQRAMLLAPGQHEFPGLTVVTRYEAAWDDAQIGGDFHDAFPLEDGKVALVVGDVMGKGLPAAARTAEVKYALRVILRDGSDCATALARLNRTLLISDNVAAVNDAAFEDDNRMVALVLAVIDPVSGITTVAAAGADAPMIARASGETEIPPAQGVLLGAAQEMEYEAVSLQLNPGDMLLLVTDGVTEAHAPGSDLFGQERLVRAYQAAAQSQPDLDATAERIISAAREFAGGTFHDDVCMLLARLESTDATSVAEA
jgi:serine phosphatase RsbU (regulator of sigma subunit)